MFKAEVYKIFYYEAFPRENTRPKNKIDKIHKFFVFLNKQLGFKVIKKELKTIILKDISGNTVVDQTTGNPKSIEKGNFDVEITIDAIRYASAFDIAIFLTGDSDFIALINYLRNTGKGKKIYVFSTENCISKELRNGTDGYFDLANFTEIHGSKLINKSTI